jgi:xylose isomerase
MAFTSYFNHIPDIKFEGANSDNPFAYRFYDPKKVVLGKTMAEWMRPTVCYWHTICGTASDPFGPGTIFRAWDSKAIDPVSNALHRTEVFFDILTKLGVKHYAFHDRDIAPEGANVTETNKNLWTVVNKLKELQKASGIELLWGTANLFSHPRFNQGASTTPYPEVYAYCANAVKEAMDATKFLGGTNYVFWGGREGYNSLLNTDIKLEQDNAGRFFRMAVDYAKKIGFTGQFLIEPKPREPSKHQYDFDSATVLGFLRAQGLFEHFKLNIEQNHATLAGHDFNHELAIAVAVGKLGSIDANRGDTLLGWDTDQFPNDYREAAQSWLYVHAQGGLGNGGLNFDAKVRRDSTEIEDIFHAHICGIDTWARGLLIAEKMINDGKLAKAVDTRYAGYKSGIGADIVSGKADFESLQKFIVAKGDVASIPSAKQEYLENLFNKYC